MAVYLCGLETECSSSGVANKYVTKARVAALGKSIRSDSIHTYTDVLIVAKRDIISKTETLYSDVVVGTASLNTSGDIPASGGSNYAKATVTYNQYTRTTYADGSYTDSTKSAKSATITGSTISGSNLGTTLKNRTSLGTSTPSGTVAGATRTATGIAVYLAANYVTTVTPKVSNTSTAATHVYYSGSIVAKGGDKSPTGNGAATYTFSSGSSVDSSLASPDFGGTSTFSRTYTEKTDSSNAFTVATNGTVTAANRTTTEGAARSVTVTSKLKVTYVHPSTYKTAGAADVVSSELSNDVTCTQALNKITKITISGTASSGTITTIPASGGTVTWTPTVTFSSESTLTSSSNFTITYSLSSTTNGASLSTNVTTWAGRGTTEGTVRSVTVTASVTSTYTTTAVKSSAVTTTQAANTKTYSSAKLVPYLPDSSWIVTVSSGKWGTCPASGGYIKCYGYAVYSYTATTATTEELITSDASLTFSGGMPTWVEAHTSGGYHIKTRGTTVGDARSFTVSWTYNSKTSNSLTLTQGKNEITDSNYNPSGYTASVSIGNLGTVATNILGDKGWMRTSSGTTNTDVGTLTTSLSLATMQSYAGKTLCFSYVLNRPNAGTTGTNTSLGTRYGIHWSLVVSGSQYYPLASLLTTQGTHKLVYCTYTVPASANIGGAMSMSIQAGGSTYAHPSSGTWSISDVKLEVGSTPTRTLTAQGGAGVVTCDGLHNAYNKYTSGSVDSATHVVKDGATIAITTNGNNRFGLSSNTSGAWLSHTGMGTYVGTDTVTITATNKNSSTATATATKSITNSATYGDVQPLTSYYPWVGAGGGSATPTITYELSVSYTSGITNTITSGATITYTRGTYIYGDPMFYNGNNSIIVYNNSQNGTVTHTRGAISGVPNGTGQGITIKTNGTASPNLGGWYFGYVGTAGLTYICSFTANVPAGRNIEFNTNSIGSGGTSKWLTPHAGLGKWATYAYEVTYGTSPSSSFFFSVTGASPVTWYLGTAYMIKSSGVSATTPAMTSAGVFTIASRGTTICNAGSITNAAVKATITLNGKSSTVALYPEQAGNYVTKVVAGVTSGNSTHVTYANITAGGTSSSPTGHGLATYTFSSGGTVTDSTASPSFGGTASYARTYAEKTDASNAFSVNTSTGVVTTSSRGTTIGAARSVTVTASLTVTYTHTSTFGGGAVKSAALAHDVTCTLAANSLTLTGTAAGGSLTNPAIYPAAGENKSVASASAASLTVTGTFSSGSTATKGTHFTVSNPTYSWSSNQSYATLTSSNAASIDVTMNSRGGTYASTTRTAIITRKATFTVAFVSGVTGTDNTTKTANATATVTQAANTLVVSGTVSGGALTAPGNYDAGEGTLSVANKTAASNTLVVKLASGSAAPSDSYTISSSPTYSWGSNESYATLTSSNAASLNVKMVSRATTYSASTRSAIITRTATYTVTFASGYTGSGSGNKTGIATATVTQNKNLLTITTGISGGAISVANNFSAGAQSTTTSSTTAASASGLVVKFESGSTATINTHYTVGSISYSWASSNTNYFTVSGGTAATTTVTSVSRGTTSGDSTRSATITRTATAKVTYTANYGNTSVNSTANATCTATQDKNVVVYTLDSMSCTYSNIGWKGGSTSNPAVSYTIVRKWSSGSSAGANITSGGTLSFAGTVKNSSGATINTSSGVVTKNSLNTTTADVIVMSVTPSVTYSGTKLSGSVVNVSQTKVLAGLDVLITNNSAAGACFVYMISSSSTKPTYNASGWTYVSSDIALDKTATLYANGTGVSTPYYVNIKYITSSNWSSYGAVAPGTIAQYKISDYQHYAAKLNTSAFGSTTAATPTKGYLNDSTIVTY